MNIGDEPQPNFPPQNFPPQNVFLEHQHQEMLQRREFKHQRILASKEDKRIHALNTILEYTELRYPQKGFSIYYDRFNYGDLMDERRMLERFLETARDVGCFKSFKSESIVNNVKFCFQEVDVENIKKFKEKLEKEIARGYGKIIVIKQDIKKLKFYPESGNIEYENELGEVKNSNKDYAFLSILNENKNTSFNVEDIRNHCNPLVDKDIHKFRKEKDIDDTIRQIKFKLKVKKGAYFPILKRGAKNNKSWLWVEK